MANFRPEESEQNPEISETCDGTDFPNFDGNYRKFLMLAIFYSTKCIAICLLKFMKMNIIFQFICLDCNAFLINGMAWIL